MVDIIRAADLTQIGANGGGWVADIGTTSPGDPLVQPLAPWAGLGAISDDGLVQGFDEDSQEFTPWGYTSPFRTQITKSLRTFQITAWETGRTTVKSLQYRLPVVDLEPDEQGLTSYAETASPLPDKRSFWFVIFDGPSASGFYVPEGEVTERSDVTYKQDEIAGYEWTITAFPDAEGNTVYHSDRLPVTPSAPAS